MRLRLTSAYPMARAIIVATAPRGRKKADMIPDGLSLLLFINQYQLFRALPQLDRAVMAARGQELAIGREDDGVDLSPMPFEGQSLLAGDRIPEPHGPVLAGRDDGLAVGREAHGEDPVDVSTERDQEPAVGDVPDRHASVFAPQGQPGPSGEKASEVTFSPLQDRRRRPLFDSRG